MSEGVKAMSKHDSKYDEWEVKDAHRALTRAEEIKKDPKMMKLVQAYNKKQKKAIESIEDLKVKAKELEDKGE